MPRSRTQDSSPADALFAQLMDHRGDPFRIMASDAQSRLEHARDLFIRLTERWSDEADAGLAVLLESLDDGVTSAPAKEMRALAARLRPRIAPPTAATSPGERQFSGQVPRATFRGNVVSIADHRGYQPQGLAS